MKKTMILLGISIILIENFNYIPKYITTLNDITIMIAPIVSLLIAIAVIKLIFLIIIIEIDKHEKNES